MSKQTDKSLFIDSSMQRFYQQLLSGVVSYETLGNRIVKQIKAAHGFRQVEQVRELARILINIPIKEYQLIAQYYLAWCKCRSFQYDADVLETIAGQIRTYKTQVLLSRGTFEAYQSRPEPALYFYAKALKASNTISDYVGSSLAIAVVKSIEGFHKSALIDLEKLVSLIRHTEPRLYYDFLNSYAVELNEAGRKDEARNIVRHVLASPFIHAYPEWRETARDLKQSNRSLVAIGSRSYVPHKVLNMPANRHEVEIIEQSQLARVFSLQQWKKKMAKKKEKPPQDEKEKFFWIMNIYTNDETSDHERHKIYEAVRKIIAERDNPKPDDDDA